MEQVWGKGQTNAKVYRTTGHKNKIHLEIISLLIGYENPKTTVKFMITDYPWQKNWERLEVWEEPKDQA